MDEGNQILTRVAGAICGGHGWNPAYPSSDDFKAARAAIEVLRAELIARRDRAELTEPQWIYISDFLDAALTPPPSGEM
jgi:hypothetical protein